LGQSKGLGEPWGRIQPCLFTLAIAVRKEMVYPPVVTGLSQVLFPHQANQGVPPGESKVHGPIPADLLDLDKK
jgi:hypothetical protein